MIPRYSFILPAYKREFLKEAIDSILGQTFGDFELVIVDDCSPEKLNEVVDNYKDTRITCHRNEKNLGREDLVSSWNHALTYAKGEYVILASDDDIYDSAFLSEVEKLTQKYPEIDEIRARVERIDEKGNTVDVDQLYQEYMTQEEFMFWMGKGLIDCMANHVFRTKALREAGWCVNFPCAWFSDDATALVMAKNGIAHTEKPLFRFRRSNISMSYTVNVATLKKKVIACCQYYDWIHAALPNNKTEQVRFFQYRVKERCITDLQRSIHQMPCTHIFYVINLLRSIKWLYTKERIMLFVAFLIHFHKD